MLPSVPQSGEPAPPLRVIVDGRYYRCMSMSPVEVEPSVLAAKLFRGLGDPTRLRVVLSLLDGERRVVDLVEDVGAAQSTVSAHLACLRDCGLVTMRPDGRQSFYRLARPELLDLLAVAEQLLAANGQAIELCPNYECEPAR